MANAKLPALFRIGTGINALIAPFAPQLALSRDRNLMERQIFNEQAAHYNAAGSGGRASDFRRNRTDAIEAGRWDRSKLSWISRDMLRNNPRAVKLRNQIVGQVVASGIAPALPDLPDQIRAPAETRVRRHCLSTDFDVAGRLTMKGQQVLAFGTMVADGEVLIRRRYRRPSDGYALNFQTQILEADFINDTVDGALSNGNTAVQGIEFDKIGRRVAYHLYEHHPGGRSGALPRTVRVAAENIIHLYRVDRPGQVRGVSWFAPVITLLHELQKYQEGQVKRQEIAAMFAGVFTGGTDREAITEAVGELSAGAVLQLNDGEELDFTDPPQVNGYGEFMDHTDRVIAAAMYTTFHAFKGDYTGANYTGGRMGRQDIDPVVKDFQHNLLIGVLCNGFGNWIAEALNDMDDLPVLADDMVWTPPARPVLDPTKDYPATEKAMRSGLISRRASIRSLGEDPVKVEAEIKNEREQANADEVIYTSDPAHDTGRASDDNDSKGKKSDA